MAKLRVDITEYEESANDQGYLREVVTNKLMTATSPDDSYGREKMLRLVTIVLENEVRNG